VGQASDQGGSGELKTDEVTWSPYFADKLGNVFGSLF